MELSLRLSRLRKAKKLTQKCVADYLTEHGPKTYTFKTVSQWETGVSEPSVEAFLLLCELYGVTDIPREFGLRSSASGGAPLPSTGALNSLGNERLGEYARLLARDPLFRETPARREVIIPVPAPDAVRRKYTVRLYDLPASAGAGVFLDGEAYDEYETDDDAARYADFAIRISGDSMSPEFGDGQIVYVEQTRSVSEGEIGIFTLNGDGYCKKLGHGCLISINPDYDPIELSEYDSLYVLGRVIM